VFYFVAQIIVVVRSEVKQANTKEK
jgi:hypothetical protein